MNRGVGPIGEMMNRKRRLLLTALLLAAAGGLVGLGAYATFTSSAAVSRTDSTGTVTLQLGATGASTNRLDIGASGLVPGDTIQRSVDLINSGNQDMASITLTTNATVSSLLDTDTTHGLQVVVERCSVAWTEGGVAPAYTYACGGATTTVLASRALIGPNMALANLTTTTAGNTDHLRVTLSLPSSANNTFQNLSSTTQFTFTGTQRAGTNK